MKERCVRCRSKLNRGDIYCDQCLDEVNRKNKEKLEFLEKFRKKTNGSVIVDIYNMCEKYDGDDLLAYEIIEIINNALNK